MSQALADRRYRVAGAFPPVGVVVFLNWAGWEGRGVRLVTAGRGGKQRETWHEVNASGRPVGELAPAGAFDRKGRLIEGLERPSLWWPLEPAKWRAALPEPVTIAEPQMWSSRQKFAAVEEAEAAELAREMEADREAARAQGGRDDGAVNGQRRVQWWRDASQITHSQPPKISRREVEGRLMRALAGGVLERLAPGGVSTMAGQVAGTEDDAPEETVERLVQTPRDLADELTALGWYNAICQEEGAGFIGGFRIVGESAEVLQLAADERAFSWVSIAKFMDVSRTMAQEIYRLAIVKAWAIANGMTTAGVQIQRDKLEALRSRNRKAKIGGSAW